MAELTPIEKVVQILRESNQHIDNEEATELAEKVFAVARWEAAGAFPHEEADNVVLGPGVFVTKDRSVLNWDGVNYVPQKIANLQPELKAYTSGEYVEVLKAGDWMPGRISSKQPGILNVDTERGPVTVGSALRIRKVSKA